MNNRLMWIFALVLLFFVFYAFGASLFYTPVHINAVLFGLIMATIFFILIVSIIGPGRE